MHRDLAGKMDEILEGINRINHQHRPVDLLQSEPILDNETENLGLHLEEIVLAAESVKESFSVPPTQPSSQASVPMSSDGTDFTSISIDNSPDITHVEPLQELAQRFKKQAEHDWEYHMYKDAEVHHVESMKCFKELHDAHSISFDDFNNMSMTLAKIYKALRKFVDAKMIVQRAAKHPLTYDRELGWRNLLLDAEDNTEHRAQTSHEMAELLLAEFQTNSGSSHLSVDCGKTDEVLLRDAERHAKRAFRIRRNLNEKDHESCKESARLLVDIYNNYTDKSMYAETYNDMYLLDDTTRGPPGSIVQVSAHFNLAEAINDHAISPDDVMSNVDLTDLDNVLDRKSALIVAMDCPKYGQCHRCHIIVDRLLRLGADRNAPFAHAIKKDQISDCKLLLRHGANINWLDARRFTPLMHAVKKGNLEMIRYLLGEQPDINARGYQGQTVLHLAAQTWVDDVFKLLLETAGLDIDATDDNGMTAMHHAAKHDNVIFAKRLGRAKANVEIKDNSTYQRTPLYIAIKEDKYLFVKVLLKWKAKVDLDYLPKTRSSDINNLLRSRKRGVSGSSAAG
jgi:ankyrin repeat protein